MNLLDIVITTGAMKMWSWIIATVIFVVMFIIVSKNSEGNSGGVVNMPDFVALAKHIGLIFLYLIFWIVWLIVF